MILSEFLKAFAQVFHLVIHIYIFIIVVRSIMSWMGPMPHNRFTLLLRRLTDPVFRLVHKTLPFAIIGGIDISPIIIIIILVFMDKFFTSLLLNYANKLV